jgi:hypothetical protein
MKAERDNGTLGSGVSIRRSKGRYIRRILKRRSGSDFQLAKKKNIVEGAGAVYHAPGVFRVANSV